MLRIEFVGGDALPLLFCDWCHGLITADEDGLMACETTAAQQRTRRTVGTLHNDCYEAFVAAHEKTFTTAPLFASPR